MNNKLKVLDLFSGIGGFSLGLHSTGIFDTIKFVEFDKYCKKVLNKNFPNIPIEGDIRNVKGTKFEADVITGGFPCQPFSVAGKQKGTNDNRYLWPEMFRLIKEVKPEFVLGENVQGIINLQDGMVLRQVLNDLESENFEVQCFVIPASGIGAWHQRKRVWIIGHSKTNGLLKAEYVSNTNISAETKRRQHENDEETSSSRTNNKRGSISNGRQGCVQSTWQSEDVSNATTGRWQECKSRSKKKNDISKTCEDVSNTNSGLRRRGTTIGESGENKVWGFYSEKEEQTRVDIRSKVVGCDVVPGGKTWWEIESDLCGVPNGISYELDKDRASRIKTLGNAIVPQIAREFGLAIKKVLSDSDRNG